MEAEELVSAALTAIPQASQACLVDLTTGMYFAVEPIPNDLTQLDIFAASIKEICDGEMAKGFQSSDFSQTSQQINEVVMSSDNALYVLARMREQPDLLLAVTCPISINLGMVLIKTRSLTHRHQVDGV